MNRPRNMPNIGIENIKALTDVWAGPHPRLKVHFHQSFARSTGQAASGDGRLVIPTRTDGGAEIKYDGATTHRVVVSELEHRMQKIVNAIVDDLRTIGLASGTLQLVWTLSSPSSLAPSSCSSLSSSLASSSSSKSVSASLCTSFGSCASHVVPLVQPPVSVPRNGFWRGKVQKRPYALLLAS
ncbi:hypothetical protein QOT17_016804 [Balamuthia mandrillaris]